MIWKPLASHHSLCVFSITVLFIYFKALLHVRLPAFGAQEITSTVPAAANSTLGFQKILAVSKRPGWRTRGLLNAATLTGLEIDIPIQPYNHPTFVEAFKKSRSDTSPILTGSAQAWLAHLDMLKHVVLSGFTTALIVEDDADWDAEIRKQAVLLADNMRNFTAGVVEESAPYGMNWDVLWIGHCGERIVTDLPRHEYFDPTRVDIRSYGGWSAIWLNYLQPGHRALQMAVQPVCTFAYAVTLEGAQNILLHAEAGSGQAFDVVLGAKCTSGILRCVVVNPELVHHYEAPANLGYLSEVKQGDKGQQSADDSVFEKNKGSTANIVNSARCLALFKQQCLAPPWWLSHPNAPELAPFEEEMKKWAT